MRTALVMYCAIAASPPARRAFQGVTHRPGIFTQERFCQYRIAVTLPGRSCCRLHRVGRTVHAQSLPRMKPHTLPDKGQRETGRHMVGAPRMPFN
jgi:hypothetical protein